MGRSLSISQARRLALGAQGFADRRPAGRVDRRHLRRVLGRMGLIQIDSVNVLVRSQELPLFARLGAHPRSLIGDATADGELFEYWVHEASHVQVDHHHLYRWQMESPRMWRSLARLRSERPGFLDEVERHVAAHGPIVAADLSERDGPKGPWWDWDDGKTALEVLFHTGRVAATRRHNDFARVYDLPERVIPRHVLDRPTPTESEARKQLLELAASYHGVGTLTDLTDYHRQNANVCRPLVAELVEEGRLVEVDVEGWTQRAYMTPDASIPRRIDNRALLSPFDPVVWKRDRAERLFDFHYRIEIYVPKPQRRFGYYVLPFMLGERLVGRIDLKADRANKTLLVQSAWGEPDVDHAEVAGELADELVAMASWLGLATIAVARRGDLSPALARAVPTAPIEAHG